MTAGLGISLRSPYLRHSLGAAEGSAEICQRRCSRWTVEVDGSPISIRDVWTLSYVFGMSSASDQG